MGMHSTLKFKSLISPPLIYFFSTFLLIFLLLINPHSLYGAENGGESKSSKKSLQRWTLQEWLAQKERNKLMDQWLQMHTPTPYEFFIEILQLSYDVTSSVQNSHFKAPRGSIAAYATLVGLEFQNINNAEESFVDNTFLFHLRLLGSADQSSHLTLSLGQKTRQFNRSNQSSLIQTLGQIDLTLYFNSHFGISYLFKSYYPITQSAAWGDLTGSEQKALLFIDFESLRVFGGVFTEIENQTLNSLSLKKTIQGNLVGIRLYF